MDPYTYSGLATLGGCNLSSSQRLYNYHVDETLPSYMSSYSIPAHHTHSSQSNRLYGDSLVNLSKQTQHNLDNLKSKLVQMDPCYAFGIEHWHPDKAKVEMPEPHIYPEHATPKWESTQTIFTDGRSLEQHGWTKSSSNDVTESFQGVTVENGFCYLCTTLEEHQQHLAKRGLQLKPKQPKKTQVKFIVPPPYVKPKKDEVELKEEVLYKMIIRTGHQPDAATSANVMVRLQGRKGTMKKKQLKKNMCVNFTFGRGTTESFYLKTPKLGDLHWLFIEHDGQEQKHSWFLEEVNVVEVGTNETFVFPCKNWLSLYKGNATIRRKLKAHKKKILQTEFEIQVTTGQLPLAGTDSAVYITLHGKSGTSPKTRLKPDTSQKAFQRGCMDTFNITLDEIGPLSKIKIEHDNSGKKSPDWLLEKVEVKNLDTGKVYLFPCGEWLSRDEGEGLIFRELYPVGKRVTFKDHSKKTTKKGTKKGSPQLTYEVIVNTGNVRFAGTNANIYLQMFGKSARTKEILLDNEKDNFEKGQMDEFKIEADDVGDITKVTIRQDDTGLAAGWFLDTMKIRRFFSKEEVRERLMEVGVAMEEMALEHASKITGKSITGSSARRSSLQHSKSHRTDQEQKRRGKSQYEEESDKEAKKKKKKGSKDDSDSDSSGMLSSLKKKFKNLLDSDSSESEEENKKGQKKKKKHGRYESEEDEEKINKKRKNKFVKFESDSEEEKIRKNTKVIGGKRKKLYQYNGVETWVTDSESESDDYRKKKKWGKKYVSDSDEGRKRKGNRSKWESDSEEDNKSMRKGKKSKYKSESEDETYGKSIRKGKGKRKSKYESESEDEIYRKSKRKGKDKERKSKYESESDSEEESFEKYGKSKRKGKDKERKSKYESESDSEEEHYVKYGKSSRKGKEKERKSKYESESEDEMYRKSNRKGKGKRKSKYESESDSEEESYEKYGKPKRKGKEIERKSKYESESEDETYKKSKRKGKNKERKSKYESGNETKESASENDSAGGQWKSKVYKKWSQGRVPYCDEYQFICRKWLAKDEGDGEVQRTLKPESVTTFYRICDKGKPKKYKD